ncbi:hypothetical protein Ptr902_09796 [Pyrenophora tritici-repentis]|nr:hypothetical protein Ptr902_09796 [Pyrenophora tritici-repentis]
MKIFAVFLALVATGLAASIPAEIDLSPRGACGSGCDNGFTCYPDYGCYDCRGGGCSGLGTPA